MFLPRRNGLEVCDCFLDQSLFYGSCQVVQVGFEGACTCVFKSELSDDSFSEASKITAVVPFSQKSVYPFL